MELFNMTKKKEILYLHVNPSTKRWLKAIAKKQGGHVSQSTMAEQIFIAARKLGIYASPVKGKASGSNKTAHCN
jgi:hypothetical protein